MKDCDKEKKDMNYYGLLRENQMFQTSYVSKIIYELQSTEYAELRSRYKFIKDVSANDSQQILALLQWVNRHIHHVGNYDNSDKQDSLTLLELAYDKEFGVNCLSMSIVLCECLLAVGIRARVMYMMPAAVEDGDNHVVVEAYAEDLQKWIMLDPTYGSYCYDRNGRILNLCEMRNCIINGEAYSFSEGMNYNGQIVDDIEDVKNYYAKNLFFLRCKSRQGYGQHVAYGDMLEFAPPGFDVHKRMIQNLNYRIETYGDCEIFRRWMAYEEGLENVYGDVKGLYL